MHTRTDLLDCTRSWVPPAIAAAPAIERPTVKTPAARNRCNMISSWYRPPPHSPSAGFAPCITSTSSDLTPCRRRVLSPGDLGVTSQRTSRRCFLKLVDGFDQLQQAERLDQILVGTRFKTSRTVFTLPPSGQQNDLGADQLGISLDAPAHLQSINAPGIITSRSTRSGRNSSAILRPACPSAASNISYATNSMVIRKSLRISAWSSTISIFFMQYLAIIQKSPDKLIFDKITISYKLFLSFVKSFFTAVVPKYSAS